MTTAHRAGQTHDRQHRQGSAPTTPDNFTIFGWTSEIQQMIQLAAISRALAARRTCPTCGLEKPYYIPRSIGECNDCTAGGYR
jgi:hypothetical protein